MILVIGGHASGKRAYVEQLGYGPADFCCGPEEQGPVAYGIQDWVAKDPAGAMERLTGAGGHFRLLPYRSVGVDRGLLLAVRVDRAVVNGADRGAMVVALSPNPVSDGGGYGALLGEC